MVKRELNHERHEKAGEKINFGCNSHGYKFRGQTQGHRMGRKERGTIFIALLHYFIILNIKYLEPN